MYYGVYSVNCICMVTFIRSRLTYIYDINYYHLVYCYCLATLLPSTDVWQHVVKTIDRISNGNCLKTLTIYPSLSNDYYKCFTFHFVSLFQRRISPSSNESCLSFTQIPHFEFRTNVYGNHKQRHTYIDTYTHWHT